MHALNKGRDKSTNSDKTTYNGRVGLHAIHRALEACYLSIMHSRNAISRSYNQSLICLFDENCKTLDMLSVNMHQSTINASSET